jgi:hypothetical protein
MKVFISYSTKDRPRAETLFGDLQRAGAQPFQFGKSERFDDSAWAQIIRYINECDAFVVLISSSALASTAVQEEIKIAHHRYINSDRKHPARIVSAIIEKGTTPPLDIDRFPHLDLLDYTAGLRYLVRELGLKMPAAAAAATITKLPKVDLEEAAARFAENRPTGLRNWLGEAGKLLTAYQEVKPSDAPRDKEPEHIDSLLASISGKSPASSAPPKKLASADEAFLGVDLTKGSKKGKPDRLTKLLLDYDPATRNTPLDAPCLTLVGNKLSWTAVKGAAGYVVEQSLPKSVLFLGSEVYSGTDTTHTLPALALGASRYRVKAVGGVFRPDSAWSNIVRRDLTEPVNRPQDTKVSPYFEGLPAPTLEVKSTKKGVVATWSAVKGAQTYVLERASWPTGVLYKEVYAGPETKYVDKDRLPAGLSLTAFASQFHNYRVKAKGRFLSSPWSDVVMG